MNFFAQSTRCHVAIAAVAALGLLAGCGKKTATDVLARVGEQNITVADFNAELQRRVSNRQAVPAREKLLEEMIVRVTLVQRAKSAGLENAADVRRTVEDVLIAKLKGSELEPKLAAAKVSPEEVRAAYDNEISRFTQPAKTRLAMIYISANPKSDTNLIAEIATRANEARRLALELPGSVPGFGAIAGNYSEDQLTRYRGGDAGWHTAGNLESRWPKTVVAAGLSLKNTGEISDVIKTSEGFYLIKKMDERASVVTPFEQVQGGLERRLLAAKHARAEEEFRSSLRAAAKVETDLQLLSQVAYPTQSLASTAKALPPSLPASP